jgi:hypothetical protein
MWDIEFAERADHAERGMANREKTPPYKHCPTGLIAGARRRRSVGAKSAPAVTDSFLTGAISIMLSDVSMPEVHARVALMLF